MLGKLMKYEFQAMGRMILPLFAALILTATVNMILGQFGLDIPANIAIVLSVILIVGICALVFILTIQRFWSNILSSEGYLMMTLPVKTDSIILSKLFVAFIWNVASLFVIALAIIIMSGFRFSFEYFDSFRQFLRSIGYKEIILIIQGLALLIISTLQATLMLYACMSLGMLVNKYRPLLSFGAFIGITTVIQILGTIITLVGISTGLFSEIGDSISALPTFYAIQVSMWILIGVSALLGVIFYFVTRYMLKRRLNLQ